MGSYVPPSRSAIELQYVAAYTAPGRTVIVLQYDPGVQEPIVTTRDLVTVITAISALGNGNITDDGSATISQHGMCYKIGADPVNLAGADGYTEEGVGVEGAFTSSMTSLTGAKRYYYRAYATNSEGTGYGDAVDFLTALLLSETMSVAASMNKGVAATRAEVFALADNIELQKTFVRSLLESIHLSDGDIERVVRVLHENAAISDDLRKSMRRMLGDTTAISDGISLGLVKGLCEALPLSSQISISLALDRKLLEDLPLDDNKKASISRALAEVLPLASAVSKAIGKTVTDVVQLDDAYSRQINFTRNLAEALGLSDGDTEYLTIRLTETLALSADPRFALTRTIADIFSLADNVLFGCHLGLSETLSLADGIAKVVLHHLGDALVMSDNVKKELVITRILQEVLTAQDRLRIGDVWDDPTTKIWAAILEAALKVEVF